MNDQQIVMVELFVYLGSLKLADGNCTNDIRSRTKMVKKKCLIWYHSGETGNKQRTAHGISRCLL